MKIFLSFWFIVTLASLLTWWARDLSGWSSIGSGVLTQVGIFIALMIGCYIWGWESRDRETKDKRYELD